MMRSLPCGIFGARAPVPDNKLTSNMIKGVCKRLFPKVGSPEEEILQRFGEFVEKFCSTLPTCNLLSFEDWAAHTNLPAWKVQAMREDYERYFVNNSSKIDHNILMGDYDDIREVSGFGKAETLVAKKPLRMIAPVRGAYKSIVAPYFHWLERYLFYESEYSTNFVKKVAIRDRPGYIHNILGPEYETSKTMTTDYSSFECSFSDRIMAQCEMKIYEHCFGHLPVFKYIQALGGLKMWNGASKHCLIKNSSKKLKVWMPSTRMSGEMNTSLGNSITNMLITHFMVKESGGKDVRGVFEGDDGLFRYEGPELNISLASKLGFALKAQRCKGNTASFCGNVFDLETNTNIADPWYVLFQSGWSFSAVGASARTLPLLAAAKGLSLMYQYPNSPIIPHLGMRFLRTALNELNKSEQEVRRILYDYYVKSQRVDEWERNKYLEVCLSPTPNIHVEDSTRAIMEEVFKMPKSLQVDVESALANGTGWLCHEGLLQAAAIAQIPQLDGSTVDYIEWFDNFRNVTVDHQTPTEKVIFQGFESKIENESSLENLQDGVISPSSFILDFPHVLQFG